MARAKKIINNNGYTLVELSISLTIIAILASIGLGTIGKQNFNDKYQKTLQKIEVVEKAIASFYKLNGYIPCPAQGNTIETDWVNFGFSQTYNTATKECEGSLNSNTGMIPVRTLGINDEYAYDAWNRRFTYRIAKGMGSAGDFNSSSYTGDIRIVNINGLEITNINGTSPNNYGAVYVIISHGANGDQYGWGRNTVANPAPPTTTIEYENANHSINKIYLQNIRTANFDDIVAFKTKISFVDIKRGISPVAFSKQTCSNASFLSNYSIPSTSLISSAFSNQVQLSAQAVDKLCNNPPTLCNFTPTDIAGLRVWWDGSTAAVANNTNLSSIENKALPGTHKLVQIGVLFMPSYKSAGNINLIPKGAVVFNLISFMSTNLSSAISESGVNYDYTVFFVGKLTYNSRIYDLVANTCTTKNTTFMLKYGDIYASPLAVNLLSQSHYLFDNSIYINQSEVIDIPVIIVARYSSSTTSRIGGQTLYFYNKNGVFLRNDGNYNNFYGANNMSCPSTTWEIKLGMNGVLGEFLLYRQALSDYDISKVIEYLSNRWFTNVCS